MVTNKDGCKNSKLVKAPIRYCKPTSGYVYSTAAAAAVADAAAAAASVKAPSHGLIARLEEARVPLRVF